MSFVVSLGTDLLSVDPGATTALPVEIRNEGQEPDSFEVTIEGLDADWVTLPSSELGVAAGASVTEKLLLRTQRSPDNAAGQYPFNVRVRSLNSGDVRSERVIMDLKPFHQVSLDVEPKKYIVGGLSGVAQFVIKLINLSNVEHTFQINATEPENRVSFNYEFDRLAVGPGQERELLIDCTPLKKAIFTSARLYGLTFTARSIEHPKVTAYSNAQLEARPLVSPVPVLSVVGIAALGFAWYAALPKAPNIEAFTVDRTEITAGEEVKFTWRVEGAKEITIKTSDQQEFNSAAASDTGLFRFDNPGDYTITLTALRGEEKSTVVKRVKVNPRAVIPDPEILSFRVQPESVTQGESITITYDFNSTVKRARLLPLSYELDLTKKSFSLIPTWQGKQTLVLIAENTEGKSTRKEVTVEVEAKCQASIAMFDITPTSVKSSDGHVAVSWRLVSAAKAQLFDGITNIDIDPVSGSYELKLSKSTKVVITAIDTNGKKVTKSISVTVIPDRPEDEPNPVDTTPPPTTEPPTTNP